MVATVSSGLLSLVDRSAADAPEAATARPALEASLYGRATNAVRTWTGNPAIEIALVVVGPGDPVVIERGAEETLHVALPLRWVPDVWGRGLAVVGDRLAIELVDAADGRTTLRSVGTDLSPPRTLTITLE
jgi:hypothetical protein